MGGMEIARALTVPFSLCCSTALFKTLDGVALFDHQCSRQQSLYSVHRNSISALLTLLVLNSVGSVLFCVCLVGFIFSFLNQAKLLDSSMADMFQKTGVKKLSIKVETSMWAAKVVLLCVGFVTTIIFFKVALLPYTYNLLLSTLPPLWTSLRSWLSPPYIYIILNFIIIFIAASSSTKFKYNSLDNNFKNTTANHPWQEEQDVQQRQEESNPNFSIEEKYIDNPLKETSDSYQNKPENITGEGEEEVEETLDTLEDTWRLITEGKGKTVKPELKMSGTWDTPPRVVVPKEEEDEDEVGVDDGNDPVAWARREMRKSDTFNDRVTLRKREIIHKSMTQDELTQRVEAFINNFSKNMRLQRQDEVAEAGI